MRTTSHQLLAAVLFAAAALVSTSPAHAQSVGDYVTPVEPIDLKIKDRVIATVKPKDVLKVEKVQEDWIWVATTSNDRGWLMKGDVKPTKAPKAAAPDSPDAPVSPLPGQSVSPSPSASPSADPPVDDRLYLIGAMGATQVYLSYAYIGAIGDGFVNKSYDSAKVKELMGEVSGMSQHLVTQLKKVNEGELTAEDREAITQMIDINTLLKKEADALASYSEKPSPLNAETFENVRIEVWPKIAKLLGIKTEGEEAKDKPAK
jgi:hypothetical protein